jgi:hypothetical protein
MSGKKTRHLKGVVYKGTHKLVWCPNNKTYHFRSFHQISRFKDWSMLVQSVTEGTAAPYTTLDTLLEHKTATLVMG